MDQDHQERIRQRAHEIWESEGRPEGRDADHWSRAEEELRNQTGQDDQTGSGDMSGGQGGDSIQSPDVAQTADESQPRLMEQEPKKRTRKSTKATSAKAGKSASATSTPYLNDGP